MENTAASDSERFPVIMLVSGERLLRGCPAFLLNIEKRSLPRLMLSGDGLASNVAV